MDEQKKRPLPHSNNKRKRKKRLTKIGLGIILGFLAVIVLVFALCVIRPLFFSNHGDEKRAGETLVVTIPEGSSTADIAQILKENDLIDSAWGFRMKSKSSGYDGTYKQGTYQLDYGMDQLEMMAIISSGEVYHAYTLVVPEGFTTVRIAQRVEELGICTAQEFIQECQTGTFDYTFLENLPDRTYRLEGYLFPDTYYFEEGATARDVVNAMLKRFEQIYETYQDDIEASSYSLDQIITMASIVEREIALDDERAIAAGVIYNRLKDGMRLQIDATVLYGQLVNGEDTSSVNLESDSPYNTYLNQGLPIGPIANPGEASIIAALNPASHNYIYYVLESADQENHIYCETYEEFLEAKANYQKTLS